VTPPLVSLATALLAAAVALPGPAPVGLDYLAYDPATNRVWVPAGNTGNVDVLDLATGKLTVIGGFATAPPRRPGRPRLGPSSATVGDGVVWIGDRADGTLAAFDARTLAPRGRLRLPTMPDGLQYVARTRQVWVTTPGARAVTIVGAGAKEPRVVATVPIDGQPEGYAVDEARGLFYTNLEDADATVALDVATHRLVARWPAGCGAEGPRGLALDEARRWLFVACTNGARVLDVGHDGRVLGRLDTDGGVDNLAYDPAPTRRALFVASSRAGTLVVASVSDDGALHASPPVPTAPGARNPILDARGTAYVEDGAGGRLLIVTPALPHR
jgi:DNA-binding beta-propeller fold protein YncE